MARGAWEKENVLVVGAGISGIAASRLARSFGAAVTLSDAKERGDIPFDFTDVEQQGIRLRFGSQPESLLDGVTRVIVSPAVPVRSTFPSSGVLPLAKVRVTSYVPGVPPKI